MPRFSPYPQTPMSAPYLGYFPSIVSKQLLTNPSKLIQPGYPMPPQGYFPPMLPGIPFMPPAHIERNLFVYHLPQNADDTLLYRLFSPFGAIESAKAVIDSAGLCKGK